MHCQCTAPEEWRAVVGYEGWYSVSSCGRVRRDRPGKRTVAGKILLLKAEKNGYLRVQLFQGKHASGRSFSVHVLVMLAFVGPRPAGQGINHINGVKSDNHRINLEWATPRENSAHAIRLGLITKGGNRPLQRHPRGDEHPARRHPERLARGERHGVSKLTESSVVGILTSPLSAKELAKIHNVSTSLIYMIRKRQVWSHVVLTI
jgi:hypothetical protein